MSKKMLYPILTLNYGIIASGNVKRRDYALPTQDQHITHEQQIEGRRNYDPP